MADSLFDNRYRYDYIYPRGRSGETLRAVDTQDKNRPIVIKRPAPNDAPPIRAGQEVSIVNEREALTRLAGHGVLAELLGTGQFFVGGMPHQYIVMERAMGIIIADEVAQLASQRQRLPELEMLVIIAHVVDLLQAAHDKDIVYNDVDAKHLFWDRGTHNLKVIDWGNAVFLEGDEVTPQGISRQTDVYQVGELLYFILSGGHRAEIPRDADEDFKLDFHEDDERVHSRLQEIVSQAVHPNMRLRYSSLKALGADLSRYRASIERERNATVSHIADKLRNVNLSRNELISLQTQLDPALKQDPGYPPARDTHHDISNRVRDLAVSADLDAVYIYMENSNWSRAADLLNELRDRAGTQTEGIVRLLLDWCILLTDTQLANVPHSIIKSIALIFESKPDKAANALLITNPENDDTRSIQWRMAERISSHFPDVLLLRPNLYRLENAVRQLATDGIPVREPTAILQQINTTLDATARMDSPRVALLRDKYREVVDNISSLYTILQTLSIQHEFSERRLPLNVLTRALNAAMALADNMHVIGKQAAASPRDALGALDASRAIDPANPVWNQMEDFLSHLYEILQSSQTYVPSADGSDLAEWLSTKLEELVPFSDQLFDEMLSEMIQAVQFSDDAWRRYREVVISGDKTAAVKVLHGASQAVTTISPTLSGWFNQLRSVIDGAQYIEKHSIPGLLGRALADGWQAFDRGQLADAERLGQQAMEISRNDEERAIAERLWRITRLLREWIERNGIYSESRTQNTLADIEKLYTESEKTIVEAFSTQMPSNETYLKAMGQGLVRVFETSSSAALRILFSQYVLLGVLDAHDGHLDDAGFWRTAAARTFAEIAEKHVAVRSLDDFIARRRDLLDVQQIFSVINGKHILPTLSDSLHQLENNPEARLINAGIQSLRIVETAVQDWADAEFRAAGTKLEQAIRNVSDCESAANITLTNYRAWLMELQAAVIELSVQRRKLYQEIDRHPDDPQELIQKIIHVQAQVTQELLGDDNANLLMTWHDTYELFLDTYTSDLRRSHKLEELNELFKAMFIDRHPTYPLYRHWYDVVDNSPEFPAPDPDAPPPEVTDEEVVDLQVQDSEGEIIPEKYWVDPDDKSSKERNRLLMIGGGIGVIVVIGLLIALSGGGDDGLSGGIALTITDTPSADDIATLTADAATDTPTDEPTLNSTALAGTEVMLSTPTDEPTDTPEEAFNTPIPLPSDTHTPEDTDIPTATHTDTPTATLTHTHTPTPTDTATATYTPTITYTPSNTPTATLPPEGIRGSQDLLTVFNDAITDPFWNQSAFILQDGAWRLGVGNETEGETIYFFPPTDVLNTHYGNNAPSRIIRIEANLTLRTFNPAVVSGEEVYFGIMFQSTNDGNNAGIQIQAVQPSVINLALVDNNEANFISQRSVNAVIARLRLDRNLETGDVIAFFNDSQIGDPIDFLDPDDPIVPVIFVKDGGVIIGVTSWRITLD